MNVLSIAGVTFLHDKAQCMKELVTGSVLKEKKVVFFGNDCWLGYSLDLNIAENLGVIIIDCVEDELREMVNVDCKTLQEKNGVSLAESRQTLEDIR